MLIDIKNILNSFAKKVIRDARGNLTRQKKNSSKALWKSLEGKVSNTSEGFSIEFLSAPYGDFIDKGVKGAKSNYVENKNSPYSYKDKMPPISSLDKWVVRTNIKGVRDNKGRFISRQSLKFMIARSIYNKGIKASFYFTKPFNKHFNNLDKEIQEAITEWK